jgi:phosphatidate cytidylyltransferase
MLVLFWMAIPLSSFFALGWTVKGPLSNPGGYHHLLPLSVIVLVWINDTFAYVVGKLMGRHKLTPRLSPGKTWEGLIGGMVFSALGGWMMYRFAGTYELWVWILLAFITGVFGLMGDLFESGLKRKRNLKDTGGILPGHGGVLDRFDSLLFIAPVVFLVLLLIKG